MIIVENTKLIRLTNSCAVAVCLHKTNPLLIDMNVANEIFEYLTTNFDSVTFLICDTVALHEKIVSKGTSYRRAQEMVLEETKSAQSHLSNLIERYQAISKTQMKVITWDDITDETYSDRLKRLRSRMERDPLKSELEECAVYYLTKRNPNLHHTPYRIKQYREYIQKEIVSQLYGIDGETLLFHPVYVEDSSKANAKGYPSPILDLKESIKKHGDENDTKCMLAETARIFVPKKC